MDPIAKAHPTEDEDEIAEETETERVLRTQLPRVLRTVSRAKIRLGVAEGGEVAVEARGPAHPQDRTAVLPRVRPLAQASKHLGEEDLLGESRRTTRP